MKYVSTMFLGLAMVFAMPLIHAAGDNNKSDMEKLGMAKVELTSEEFKTINAALNVIEIHGHRCFEESLQNTFGNNWKKN